MVNIMKIHEDNSGFKPVVITLEKQDEVDAFYAVSRKIGGNPSGPRGIFDKLLSGLQWHASSRLRIAADTGIEGSLYLPNEF